jgi:hypothetical protein
MDADIAETRSSSIPPGKLAAKGKQSGVTSTAPSTSVCSSDKVLQNYAQSFCVNCHNDYFPVV